MIPTLAALISSFSALAVVVRAVALIVLYRTLQITRHPLLCAGLYALVAVVGDLLFSKPLGAALLHALIVFALSSGLFFTLCRVSHPGLRWTTALLGLALAFV